jgi:hypothetical protein
MPWCVDHVHQIPDTVVSFLHHPVIVPLLILLIFSNGLSGQIMDIPKSVHQSLCVTCGFHGFLSRSCDSRVRGKRSSEADDVPRPPGEQSQGTTAPSHPEHFCKGGGSAVQQEMKALQGMQADEFLPVWQDVNSWLTAA